MRFNQISSIIFFTLLAFNSRANNVIISILDQKNITNNNKEVTLSVSWENSWFFEKDNLVFEDAVWLFGKYKNQSGQWKPINFQTFKSSERMKKSNDNQGIAIFSKPNENRITSIEIVLNINENEAIQSLYFGAIEMVSIPTASFWVGDGTSVHSIKGINNESLKIESEKELKVGVDFSSLTPISVLNVSASFPKGYEGFLCMKYEISQQQWVEFFNHLSLNEQQILIDQTILNKTNNYLLNPQAGGYFNGIKVEDQSDLFQSWPAKVSCDGNNNLVFNESDDGQTWACNYLSWNQVLMYLNWTGLRPMTELEFEKACRGIEKPLYREYSFGSNLIQDAINFSNEGSENEVVTDLVQTEKGIAQHGYSGRQGPYRVGFAAKDISDRLESGASYWGIMELSGNLWEPTVGIQRAESIQFIGNHGTGSVTPLPNGWKAGIQILRGGAWNSGIFGSYRDLAVSDRYYYDLKDESARNTTGGRGVRSLNSLE